MINKLNFVKQYGIILFFSFVYAIGISLFLAPNNLAPGGISGLSIIISHYTHISYGLLYGLINIPIIILGIYKLGIKILLPTIITVVLTSTFTNLLSYYPPITENLLLAALCGGTLVSLGLSMFLKNGSTSGGVDIIVRILKLKYPHIETGKLFLIMDIFVVILSAIAFKNIEIALFAAVAVITSSIIMDKILYGTEGAKLVFIISEHYEEISNALLLDLDIGVTYINGFGAYTHSKKNILMCVTRKQVFPKLQSTVKDIDDNAFMIVSSANEVLGNGFKSHHTARL